MFHQLNYSTFEQSGLVFEVQVSTIQSLKGGTVGTKATFF